MNTAQTLTSKSSAAPMHALPSGKRIVVPFSKLFLSANNVRSAQSPSTEGLKRLAAMIEVDGLLADLHASPEVIKGVATGRYAVEAGGRRWRALGLLVEARKLAAQAPIHCIVVDAPNATGVSLAENLGQESMSPADEFSAFAKLKTEGKDTDSIAKHFGVSSLHVQRRMKLAAVAPVLFELFREGKVTLDQMMALASVDDHKRQLAAWKSMPEYNRTASALRRSLTEEEVIATDDRVKLITLKRYQASGGTLRKDLFSDEVYLDDAGLANLLVAEVLTEHAESVKEEGWAWVEIFERMGYEERSQFSQPPVRHLPEGDAARTAREALEARLSALEDEYNEASDADETSDELSAALEAIDKQCEGITAELDAARRALIDTSSYDKTQLGAIVTVQSGTVQVLRGYMTADAAKAATKASARTGLNATGAAAPVAEEFSERLLVDLTSHRTAALQAALCGNPQVALVALAARMAVQVFSGHGAPSSPVGVSVKTCRSALERDGTNFATSAAAKLLDAETAKWKSLLPQDSAEWLGFLFDQPQEVMLSLLAYCTAQSVDVVQRRSGANSQSVLIAQALSLDMNDYWSAGAENFFSHVSKAKIVEVVTEVAGAGAAKDLAKMKKPEAVLAAVAALVDQRWLPTPLRAG